MWRLDKVNHKAARQGTSTLELKIKLRQYEKELRQAWRARKIVSKRILVNEADEDIEDINIEVSKEQDVVTLFKNLVEHGTEKGACLKLLTIALRDPQAHLTFIKQVNSMHVMIGYLSGSNATYRMEAIKCLHELSNSHHPSVTLACLSASPYLITFLSGQSTKFTELCLYTLGNLCPDSNTVKEKLVAQGIIPSLANCMENHKDDHVVVEAVGFALFQLLFSNCTAEKITKMVMASSLPSKVISVLAPGPTFDLMSAIECAWCLHYLTSSIENIGALLANGALLQCSDLLVSLGGEIAAGKKGGQLEHLICPLLRCLGNLVSCSTENLSSHVSEVGIVVVLATIIRVYIQTKPALAREAAWVLNNLTAHSSTFCSAVITHNLIPGLIMLPFVQDINTMIMRVIANIVHNKKESCVQLVHLGLLPALCATLKMDNQEMVTLSMDVLFMLITSVSQVAEEFVRQGGCPHLEAIQCNSDGEVRQKATHLLEHLLHGSS
ncbi:transmembrane and coiled-coil domain-containing protein 6 [Antennarius striatus]|uniref:transmembrane and coiled-coil domain-containing protein 6 n=1 Tax=Antennarius striatus TaxID=241820 RepID=UPI0035B4462E